MELGGEGNGEGDDHHEIEDGGDAEEEEDPEEENAARRQRRRKKSAQKNAEAKYKRGIGYNKVMEDRLTRMGHVMGAGSRRTRSQGEAEVGGVTKIGRKR